MKFLDLKNEGDPWKNAVGQTLLGSSTFIDEMREKAGILVGQCHDMLTGRLLVCAPIAQNCHRDCSAAPIL